MTDGSSGGDKPEVAVEAAAAPATPSESGTSLGGRVRKTTQKFTFVEAKHEDPDEFTPPEGSGAKLRDIPFVGDSVAALGKKDTEMVKALYNVMYGRRFQLRNVKVIKEQLLDFSGVVEQDDKSRAHLVGKIAKWKRSFVQGIMDLLGVDRSKKSFDEQSKPFDKDSLIDRLVDWLYNPQPTAISEKKAAAAVKAEAKKEKQKAQKAKKAAAKTKTTKRKSTSTAGGAKKKQKTTKANAEDDEDEGMEEETESEAEDSSSDFDSAKTSGSASKAGSDRRRAKRSRAVEDEEDEHEEEDNNEKEEEAQSQSRSEEKKTAAPEEESTLSSELQEKVKDIIAHGNAEELTVKKIVRQLSEDLGRDVSDQKKAIKDFITDGQAL